MVKGEEVNVRRQVLGTKDKVLKKVVVMKISDEGMNKNR